MKKALLPLLCAVILMAGYPISLRAQSLDEQLQKLSGTAAKEYLSPAVSILGANLNAGWMNRAPKKKMLGFDIDISIVAMGGKIEGKRSFYKETTFRFDYNQAKDLTKDITVTAFRDQAIQAIMSKDFTVGIGGATVLGPEGDKIQIIFGPNGNEEITVNGILPVKVTIPSQTLDLGVGGFLGKIKYLPTVAPQIKLGTVFGTQAIIRTVPSVDLPDSMGKFKYFGFGLEHNVAYWLSALIPVDITAGFLTQKIELGNTVKVSATSYGVGVSKTLGFGFLNLTPFASFLLETSTMDVNYSTSIVNQTGSTTKSSISFALDGESKTKISVGSAFKFGFFALTAEYNIAKNNSFAGAVSFNF